MGACIERPGCTEQLFLCRCLLAVDPRAPDRARARSLEPAHSTTIPCAVAHLLLKQIALSRGETAWKTLFSVADATTFTVYIPAIAPTRLRNISMFVA